MNERGPVQRPQEHAQKNIYPEKELLTLSDRYSAQKKTFFDSLINQNVRRSIEEALSRAFPERRYNNTEIYDPGDWHEALYLTLRKWRELPGMKEKTDSELLELACTPPETIQGLVSTFAYFFESPGAGGLGGSPNHWLTEITVLPYFRGMHNHPYEHAGVLLAEAERRYQNDQANGTNTLEDVRDTLYQLLVITVWRTQKQVEKKRTGVMSKAIYDAFTEKGGEGYEEFEEQDQWIVDAVEEILGIFEKRYMQNKQA